MRLLRAAAVGAAFLVAACSATPVQCGACPPVVYATVTLQGPGPPSTAVQDAMRAGVLRVCLSGGGCWRVPAGRDKQMVTFPARIDREHASGRTLTATLVPAGGSRRVWRGRGVLRDTDGGDGPCSCSYTSADLVLSR
ncbi:MAG: hypothetical protein ACTHOK_20025 [Nocardioidaceae bacterium]